MAEGDQHMTACFAAKDATMHTITKYSFKSKYQSPLFMIFQEDVDDQGNVRYAQVVWSSSCILPWCRAHGIFLLLWVLTGSVVICLVALKCME